MRIALVITDVDFYEDTRYAATLVDALRAEGAEVDRFARVPPAWLEHGPPAGRHDLAVAHVLVEEVVALGETMRVAGLLEAAGVPLVNPVGRPRRLLRQAADARGVGGGRAAAAADLATSTTSTPGRRPDGRWCSSRRWATAPATSRWSATSSRPPRSRPPGASTRRRAVTVAGAGVLQEVVEEPRVLRAYATPTRTSLVYEKHRQEGGILSHGTTYARSYDAPPELAELTQRMVATLGGGLMGVDVLVDRDGRHLALEANAPFGFDVTDPEQGRWVARAVVDLARDLRTARSA